MTQDTQNRIPLVAIVGRPNVGKSTLFNRLTQRWQAIVEDRPGITRDRLYGEFEVFGNKLRVMDTGGLNLRPENLVERKMSEQAEKGIAEADLILFVMDGRDGVTTMDRDWAEKLRKVRTPKIHIVNKLDTPALDHTIHEFSELGLNPLILLSGEKQRNFSELSELILQMLKLKPIEESKEDEAKNENDPIFENESDLEGHIARLNRRPLNIAILGRPNVGKSTLLNALLGDERSIVDNNPGTTRDPIHSYLTWEDKEYCFIDTAGIRKRAKTKERVEKFSVVTALNEMEKADVILLVIDGDVGPTDQDAHVAGYAFEKFKPMILLVNKWDEGSKKGTREELEDQLDFRMRFMNDTPTLYISAKTKKNLGKIFDAIESVREQMDSRIKTGQLNKAFEAIVAHHPLPTYRGQSIKMFYSTQAGVRPTTILIFCSEPKHVHFSYKRYLNNALREIFKLKDVPLRLIFKKRDSIYK